MDDDIAHVLRKQTEAIDQQIKAKEMQVQRQDTVNRTLLEILVKSEPLDLKSSAFLADSKPRSSIPVPFAFPTASPNAWIKCPVRIFDQWAYVIRDKIVIGIEIENIQADKCIAEISGSILAVSEDGQEWLAGSRSCLVQFRSSDCDLVETNILRQRDKAILTVSVTAPPAIFSSDFILVGHASVGDQPLEKTRLLPPVLEPQYWRYWRGELGRIPRDTFDPTGSGAQIINSLSQACGSKNFGKDNKIMQRILSSVYACQQQKRIRVEMASEIFAEEMLGNIKLNLANCLPAEHGPKYCRHPLFDGVLIFPDSSKFSAGRTSFEFLISGWTSGQIDQFLNFFDSVLNGATIMILDDESDAAILPGDIRSDYLKLTDKLGDICAEEMDLGGEENGRRVNGDEYRAIRLDMCAVEVMGHL